jgi:hypothetical protein
MWAESVQDFRDAGLHSPSILVSGIFFKILATPFANNSLYLVPVFFQSEAQWKPIKSKTHVFHILFTFFSPPVARRTYYHPIQNYQLPFVAVLPQVLLFIYTQTLFLER